MRNIFSFEGPVFSFFEKIANLLLLDILWLVCCIPVITAGASTTAMYYVALKMIKDEESSVTKSFFKSFGQNFKQSTIIWIGILILSSIVVYDTQKTAAEGIGLFNGIHIVVVILGFVLLMTTVYVFPLIAKFENTVANYIKNALIISIINAPFSLIIIIMIAIPIALVYFVPVLLPLSLFFGGSGVAYFSSFIFNRIFSRMINNTEESN